MQSNLTQNLSKHFSGIRLKLTPAWGHEMRYHISQEKLGIYQQQLKATVYRHHSSFDYATELKELGFLQTAQAMQRERSGLPNFHETQMGNLGSPSSLSERATGRLAPAMVN